jgi:hypothetical protein
MAAAWLPLLLHPDYHLFSAYQESLRFHALLLQDRSRGLWMLLNAWDFFLFLNLATAFLSLAAAGQGFRTFGRKGEGFDPLPWTGLGVLAAIDLSGLSSGEAARIWMFLGPWFLLPAGKRLAVMGGRALGSGLLAGGAGAVLVLLCLSPV